MRAIAIRPVAATAIATGKKKTEHRTRRIALGPLLVTSNGIATCVVDVVRVTERAGAVRWHLRSPRPVRPFPVRSFGWIVHVPDRMIVELGPASRGPGPYTFTDSNDRAIRGASATTPEAARVLALELADTRGDVVWIERDGFAVASVSPTRERAQPARAHSREPLTFAIGGETIGGSERTLVKARATAEFLRSFHHGAAITILRDGRPI